MIELLLHTATMKLAGTLCGILLRISRFEGHVNRPWPIVLRIVAYYAAETNYAEINAKVPKLRS